MANCLAVTGSSIRKIQQPPIFISKVIYMDKLEELFTKQYTFQVSLGNMPFADDAERQAFINMHTLALIDETMEALRETRYKNWKKNQTFDTLKFQQELVDAWHFLINLTIAAGMDAETLFERFEDKHIINIKRQQEGY